MKKFISIILTISLAFTLVSCAKAQKPDWQTSLDLGQKYLLDGNYEQAIIEFNKVIEIDPKNVEAYIGLAEAYTELGDYTLATKALEQGCAETEDERLNERLNEVLVLASAQTEAVTTAEITTTPETTAAPETTTVPVTTTITTTTPEPTTVPTTTTVPATTPTPTTTPEPTTVPVTTTAATTTVTTTAPATTVAETTAATVKEDTESEAEKLLNSVELTSYVTDYDPLTEITEKVLAEITTDEMSTYEKVKACYDYLINECEYDGSKPAVFQSFDDMGYGLMINAYDMLKDHRGVCHHYAAAFVALTRYIGLESYYQMGETHKASGGYTGHTWAVIIIDGTEYVFDPQVEANIANGGKIKYQRFCKTYDQVKDKYIKYESNFY